jgi:multidrug transporter EmrE-like cation transporter
MPGIIFFPIVNGGVIILSALSAILLFRERLPKMQLIGLIAGIISVLCLGM